MTTPTTKKASTEVGDASRTSRACLDTSERPSGLHRALPCPKGTHDGSSLTADDLEFALAMREAQRRKGTFLSHSETLVVLRSLGYRKEGHDGA